MRQPARVLAAGALGILIVASTTTLAAGASAPRVIAHGSPGITKTQVTLGAIVTQSVFAADFKPYLSGAYAYFDYVNNELGGVNGRKIKLAYALDDGASSSTNITDARTLVNARHVFAIVGISVPFFGAASYLKSTGTPTFGYATSNVWGKSKNMFADYGSILNYNSSIPHFAYVAKKTHSTKIAVVALSYASSKLECKGALTGLTTYGKTYGFKEVYSNINESVAQNWPTEALRIKNSGANMIVSCMDVNSNVALSKAMAGSGMATPVQLWLDGYGRKILQSNSAYMKKTYLLLQHVPYEAASVYPSSFPGLNLYLKEMAKYGFTSDEYSDVALAGWQSANTFTMGLRKAGATPTQASLIAAINKITRDVGGPSGGVIAPINWTIAHTGNTSPACETFAVTNGSSFNLAFNTGAHPWICFKLGVKANLNAPVKAPAGTPGA